VRRYSVAHKTKKKIIGGVPGPTDWHVAYWYGDDPASAVEYGLDPVDMWLLVEETREGEEHPRRAVVAYGFIDPEGFFDDLENSSQFMGIIPSGERGETVLQGLIAQRRTSKKA
jgi:hypothetical protein